MTATAETAAEKDEKEELQEQLVAVGDGPDRAVGGTFTVIAACPILAAWVRAASPPRLGAASCKGVATQSQGVRPDARQEA